VNPGLNATFLKESSKTVAGVGADDVDVICVQHSVTDEGVAEEAQVLRPAF
jgi:hypothetical protein